MCVRQFGEQKESAILLYTGRMPFNHTENVINKATDAFKQNATDTWTKFLRHLRKS